MYVVTYASAGCLPDGDPMMFDTLADARAFILAGWTELAAFSGAWDRREIDVASDAILAMGVGGGADDPRPGSLYRWTLELACPACGEIVHDLPHGHKLAKCWNTDGHADGGTLAFDTMTDDDGEE